MTHDEYRAEREQASEAGEQTVTQTIQQHADDLAECMNRGRVLGAEAERKMIFDKGRVERLIVKSMDGWTGNTLVLEKLVNFAAFLENRDE